MKVFAVLILSALVMQMLLAGSAKAIPVSECSKAELLGYSPTDDEMKAHRHFSLPTINYPYDAKLEGHWGWSLTMRIDKSGHVVCYSQKDEFGERQSLNNSRRALIEKTGDWRYAPFASRGQSVAAVITERVNEQELPQKHLPLPKVPLEQVRIGLERTGCFGSCPSYKIEIHGDGGVVYDGDGFVDVRGRHAYRIPRESVARLMESLRTKDIWSLRPIYRAGITDNPTYLLAITVGAQTHQLEDYVGEWVGMPVAVSDFEHEVDKVAGSDMWLHLSRDAVEHLKEEQFAFGSQAGADLLARAVADADSHDDEAMLQLIKLGAPVTESSPSDEGLKRAHASLIVEALSNHRAALIDLLIARGALKANGKSDQKKIDAAFRAAIAGGRLALVQRIWAVIGDKPHPSLMFDDVSDEKKSVHKKSPVSLLLFHARYQEGGWEGMAIAKWLISKGCDMKAHGVSGTTLLHIATKAGDLEFVRYLLAQGMDASTPGEFGLPALGSAENEDIAMALLNAGTDFSRMDDADHGFRSYAEENHWQRVVAWLDAHRQ